MTLVRPRVQCTARAASVEWRWLLLGLLAAIAVLLTLSQSAPAHADRSDFQFVTSTADHDSDCGGTHGSDAGQCHATVACSGHAQLAACPLAFDGVAQGHPLPAAQGVGIGRTPAHNPHPPKHSNQA